MDLFAAHTALAVTAYVVLAVGLVASIVSAGVLAQLAVRNRRERLTQDALGTAHRGHALSR